MDSKPLPLRIRGWAPELAPRWAITGSGDAVRYLPITHVDTLGQLSSDWVVLSQNESRGNPNVQVEIIPHGIGTTRLLAQLESVLESGALDQHMVDELKNLFGRSRMYVLLVQYVFGVLHTIFATLAFKNEIGFYARTKNTRGMSRRGVVGRFIAQLIIWLHLYDHGRVSQIVLYTNGASLLIEGWKVARVLKARMTWTGVRREKRDEKEVETDKYDADSTRVCGWIFFPILFVYALYQLWTAPQKSWFSWAIQQLAYGVYMGGFILMIPQLYINYKLKSVAHLPWRAMTYKTFTTFVDDIFAFMIEAPWAYRLATMRDDVIFFIFLYQRYLYPTDYTRANEFGYSYETPEPEIDCDGPDVDAIAPACEQKEQLSGELDSAADNGSYLRKRKQEPKEEPERENEPGKAEESASLKPKDS